MSKEFSTFADGFDCEDCKEYEKKIRELDAENLENIKGMFFYAKKMLRYRDALIDLINDIEKPSILSLTNPISSNWISFNLAKDLLKENYEYKSEGKV